MRNILFIEQVNMIALRAHSDNKRMQSIDSKNYMHMERVNI